MKISSFFNRICCFWNNKFQKDEMKHTRLVYNTIYAFLLICVIANILFYTIESLQSILLNAMFLSLGLMFGVKLLYRAIQKDTINSQKQFEKDRKETENHEQS